VVNEHNTPGENSVTSLAEEVAELKKEFAELKEWYQTLGREHDPISADSK